MKILIANDDTHEDRYCFENGNSGDIEELLHTLAPAHFENYEWKKIHITDVEDLILEKNPNFNVDEVETYINNMFDIIMWEKHDNILEYWNAFNELWELAE